MYHIHTAPDLVCPECAGTDNLLYLEANKLAWQFHNAVQRMKLLGLRPEKHIQTLFFIAQ